MYEVPVKHVLHCHNLKWKVSFNFVAAARLSMKDIDDDATPKKRRKTDPVKVNSEQKPKSTPKGRPSVIPRAPSSSKSSPKASPLQNNGISTLKKNVATPKSTDALSGAQGAQSMPVRIHLLFLRRNFILTNLRVLFRIPHPFAVHMGQVNLNVFIVHTVAASMPTHSMCGIQIQKFLNLLSLIIYHVSQPHSMLVEATQRV